MIEDCDQRRQYNQGFIEGNNDAMYGAESQFYDHCGEDLRPVIIRVFPHRKANVVEKDNFQFACGYIDGYQSAEG